MKNNGIVQLPYNVEVESLIDLLKDIRRELDELDGLYAIIVSSEEVNGSKIEVGYLIEKIDEVLE